MDSLIWGILPPLLAIVLAFITKNVIFSLFSSIIAGALIVAGGNPVVALTNIGDIVAMRLSDEWNIRIFLFCALLGGFVGLLSKTGSARAFGLWASRFIKGKKSAQIWTWFFSLIIFIDDYFSLMSVGNVMRPVTDSNKVSRAKLSYIIDSTASPICVIMPISSWVVAIMSYIRNSVGFSELNISEMSFFMRLIPFNLYALIAILMVLVVALSGRDYGPMVASEKRAKEGKLYNEDIYGKLDVVISEEKTNARFFDMLIPIFILIALCVVAFPFTADLPEGTAATFLNGFAYADSSKALLYGVLAALIFTYIYFLARRVLSIKIASDALIDGVNSMVSALVILTLAWTIGHIISSSPEDLGLNLPAHLDRLIQQGSFPLPLLPISVFVISCFISFATGTSWGTFGIMVPVTLPIAVSLATANGLAPDAMLNFSLVSVAAVLSGAVFGDHSSPISSTTVLASAGAGAPFIEHLTTQLPYALLVAFSAGVGILVAGFTLNPIISFMVALVVFGASFFILTEQRARLHRKE
ncbi:MAG: Na+/H+ antiporter NhaC family protein [Spirochaetaceae bacterium]|nr:Na+/H+ antiporter NhaC family protein [Spirochaetaceae bacterium]